MTILIRRSAAIFLTFLSFILFLPLAGIVFENDQALSLFHFRSLAKFPSIKNFAKNPAHYFAEAKNWFSDRVFPIIEVTNALNKSSFFVLNIPPQKRITMMKDGFMVLNGTDDQHLNNIFENVCVHAPSAPTTSTFLRSFEPISHYAASHNLMIDIVVIPTIETLYGDRLPESVPQKYREACSLQARGGSALNGYKASMPLHYVFTRSEMFSKRDIDGFFPKANWHPDGLSIKVARDAYLKEVGLPLPDDEQVTRSTAPSELLFGYNILLNLPVYKIANTKLENDPETEMKLKEAIAPLFPVPQESIKAYLNHNSGMERSGTALLVSDSFGDRSAPIFAAAFQHFLYILTNNLSPGEFPKLLERAKEVAPYDRLIILVHEGNIDRVIIFGEELKSAIKN